MKTAITLFSPAVLAMLIMMPIGQISASDASVTKLMVKTSEADVIGVREIESGKFEQGIRKSKAALAKTTIAAIRKPLLDNLCVAHLAVKNMKQANQYCNDAVNTGKASAISYNNRAMLHYVLGNVEASLEDLDEATKLGMFKNMIGRNLSIVNKRNILSKN
jgi:hypothetical protein